MGLRPNLSRWKRILALFPVFSSTRLQSDMLLRTQPLVLQLICLGLIWFFSYTRRYSNNHFYNTSQDPSKATHYWPTTLCHARISLKSSSLHLQKKISIYFYHLVNSTSTSTTMRTLKLKKKSVACFPCAEGWQYTVLLFKIC